jgi:hypothetical protein
MKRGRLHTNKDFLRWAKQATAGIDQSGLMLGVLGADQSGARLEFAIQVGHCLLENKPLVLIAPHGANIPEKLRVAASAVEFFDPTNEHSMMDATKRALAAVGLPVRH